MQDHQDEQINVYNKGKQHRAICSSEKYHGHFIEKESIPSAKHSYERVVKMLCRSDHTEEFNGHLSSLPVSFYDGREHMAFFNILISDMDFLYLLSSWVSTNVDHGNSTFNL